jgi:hypothetical protein
MYYNSTMHANFESEKNKKALLYTAIICAILLLLFYMITWPAIKITPPVMEDLIEVNLGNNNEGFGEEQPLIKGEMAPAQEPAPQSRPIAAANDDPAKDIDAADDDKEEAATVTKTEKNNSKKNEAPRETVTKPVKTNTPTTVTAPAPKPQKPKFTYNGPGAGKGNGATEDNGYSNQGNNPNGKGDAGDPSGKPDSYGNDPGGRSGGPKVIGNRKIIKYYSFTGDLEKATVYALVRVSPAGIGTFTGFGKNSTTRAQAYQNAIIQYLKNVQFDKSTEVSNVTVQFNFNVQ